MSGLLHLISLDHSLVAGTFDLKTIENLLDVKKVKPLSTVTKGVPLGGDAADLLANYFAYSNLGGTLSGKKLLELLKSKGLRRTNGILNTALDRTEQEIGSSIGSEVREWQNYVLQTPIAKIAATHKDMKPAILWLLAVDSK